MTATISPVSRPPRNEGLRRLIGGTSRMAALRPYYSRFLCQVQLAVDVTKATCSREISRTPFGIGQQIATDVPYAQILRRHSSSRRFTNGGGHWAWCEPRRRDHHRRGA